jgi:hypothetical protein
LRFWDIDEGGRDRRRDRRRVEIVGRRDRIGRRGLVVECCQEGEEGEDKR